MGYITRRNQPPNISDIHLCFVQWGRLWGSFTGEPGFDPRWPHTAGEWGPDQHTGRANQAYLGVPTTHGHTKGGWQGYLDLIGLLCGMMCFILVLLSSAFCPAHIAATHRGATGEAAEGSSKLGGQVVHGSVPAHGVRELFGIVLLPASCVPLMRTHCMVIHETLTASHCCCCEQPAAGVQLRA